MNSNRIPLIIIGVVIAIAIIGIIAYAYGNNKNTNTDMSNMPGMTQEEHTNMTQSTGSDANNATANSVTIQNYAFSPATITVKVGTKVTWTNEDSVEHTVTSDSGAPATIESGLFGKGETFSYTFDKAGTYAYHCQPHPYMKGTVVVTE